MNFSRVKAWPLDPERGAIRASWVIEIDGRAVAFLPCDLFPDQQTKFIELITRALIGAEDEDDNA